MSTSPPAAVELLCELQNADIAAPRAPAVALLQTVNWTIATGDHWLLASPAGAGKSALLVTAAGIQRPLKGEVRLFGRPLDGLREKDLLPLRQQVGLVFEGGGQLFPDLSLAQNIALPIAYHQCLPWAKAIETIHPLLDWLGLRPHAEESPRHLPRRLLPRAGLARALALRPCLLMLDHPWRGADPQEQQWWLHTLKELPQQAPSVKAWVAAMDNPALGWNGFNRIAVLHHRRLQVLERQEDVSQWLATHHLLALLPENS